MLPAGQYTTSVGVAVMKPIAFLFAFLMFFSTSLALAGGPAKGDAAPEVTLEDIWNSEKVSLEEFRGQVVVVEFWATNCHGCRAALPRMKEHYKRYGKEGIAFFTVCVDPEKDAVKKYIGDNDIQYGVGWDPYGDTAREYGIELLPTAYIVDPDGKIFWRGLASDHDAFATAIADAAKSFPYVAPKVKSPADIVAEAEALAKKESLVCQYEAWLFVKELLAGYEENPCADCAEAKKPCKPCAAAAELNTTLTAALVDNAEARERYDEIHGLLMQSETMWSMLEGRDLSGRPESLKAKEKMIENLKIIVEGEPDSDHARRAREILVAARRK